MHRNSILALTALIYALSTAGAVAADSISYSKRWVRNTPVHVVTVDLNSAYVNASLAIARHGIGSSEGFGSMISRLKPAAAITGTYFCVNSLIPVGDIVIDGKLVHRGTVGTGVGITPEKRLNFMPTIRHKMQCWTGFSSVVCTGPTLVRDGAVCLNPRPEGFLSKSLYRQAPRAAIGVTKRNKMLLVTVNRPIYMGRMAKIMKDLGAIHAANLDGGSSTALYCKGKVPSHPGRRMTNLIVVYESPAKFAKIKPQLAPKPVIAQTSTKAGS